jgi:hypothetical protein
MIMIVGITLSVFSNNVFGESLVKYFTDEDGTEYSYDKDSVKRQSGKVKVWTTVILGVESRSEIQKNVSIKAFENLSFTRTLDEINCKEGRTRVVTIIYYDVKRKVLYTITEQTDWRSIVPDSINDLLKSSVCK